MSAWLGILSLLCSFCVTPASAAPGPIASPPVDLSRYKLVLQVDSSRGDDIKGDGSVAKPVASIPRALELAGRLPARLDPRWRRTIPHRDRSRPRAGGWFSLPQRPGAGQGRGPFLRRNLPDRDELHLHE
jgi:hypothetical protein